MNLFVLILCALIGRRRNPTVARLNRLIAIDRLAAVR